MPEPSRGPERRPDELAEVAAAALRGDRSATHALLVALAPQLLRTVRSVFGRHHPDVEDVAQEAALVLLRALPSYRGDGTVTRFACRTAVLVAMNARRREFAEKRGGRCSASDAEVDGLPGFSEDPEGALAQHQAAQAVRTLVMTLPEAQAQALALHCMAGCSVPEIAETTGATVETVRSRLRLARQALRRRLDAEPQWLTLLEEQP